MSEISLWRTCRDIGGGDFQTSGGVRRRVISPRVSGGAFLEVKRGAGALANEVGNPDGIVPEGNDEVVRGELP